MSKETSPVVHMSADEFEKLLLEADRPVVVDFWAPWCGPCRMIAPTLDKLAEEYGEKITIAKINTDENQALAEKFGVRGIPTLLFFRKRREVGRIVGMAPEGQIRQKIEIVSML